MKNLEFLVSYAVNKGLQKTKMAKVLKDMPDRFKPDKLVKLKAKQKSNK